jgi:hypothetical protein
MASKQATKGFSGFGGRKFRMQRFGSIKIIESNNVWCQGEIPDVWKDMLKDNAKFV